MAEILAHLDEQNKLEKQEVIDRPTKPAQSLYTIVHFVLYSFLLSCTFFCQYLHMLFWNVSSLYSSASCFHDHALFLAHQILQSSRSSFALAFTVQYLKLRKLTLSISVMFF